MSQNYSKSEVDSSEVPAKRFAKYNWWMLLIVPAWVTVCFFVAQLVIQGLVWLLVFVKLPLDSINSTVLTTVLTVFIYSATILMAIGLPWVVKKIKTNPLELGITRYPQWKDILISPAGLVIYLLLSALLLYSLTRLLPDFNVNQKQDIGFRDVIQQYQYILAFISLVIVVPIAEEVLFRGYLFGKLKKYVPLWLAILVTSVLFGLLHIFNSGNIAWNLAVDTFALSIVLCILRVVTGNIWASILVHMIKNGIAFYLYFIYPLLLVTLGK